MRQIKKPNQRAERAPYAISKNGLTFYFSQRTWSGIIQGPTVVCQNTLGQNQFFSNQEFCVPTQKKHAYPARLAKWRKETLTFFSKAKFAQMILLPPESRFSHNLRFVIRSQNHFSIKLRISLKQPFFK